MDFFVATIELDTCQDRFLVQAKDRFEARGKVNEYTFIGQDKIYPFIEVEKIDIDSMDFNTDDYIVLMN
jgi:hypothetical protein